MGADKGILVTDRVLGGADTWATSQTLAGALRNIEYDLIITGRQAIDGDTAQVGPQISEHLGIPVISYAQKIQIEGDSVMRLVQLGKCRDQTRHLCLQHMISVVILTLNDNAVTLDLDLLRIGDH